MDGELPNGCTCLSTNFYISNHDPAVEAGSKFVGGLGSAPCLESGKDVKLVVLPLLQVDFKTKLSKEPFRIPHDHFRGRFLLFRSLI